MNNELNQPILTNIVIANSDKIFRTLDNFISTVKDETAVKIRIFDNSSLPEYKNRLKEYVTYPYIGIYFHDESSRFGYGHNHDLLKSDCHYDIICNPDILVDEEAVTALVLLLGEHSKCAMLALKILNEDGTTQHLIRKQLAVFDYVLRFVPFKWVKERFDKRLIVFECRDLPTDVDSYVRMVSGSFMVVDIDKFKEIRGFDERFFMYFEDNDLCLSFEKAGYKLLYTPFYTVVHFYGKGAHRNTKLFRVFLTSMIKFFNKWGWRFF